MRTPEDPTASIGSVLKRVPGARLLLGSTAAKALRHNLVLRWARRRSETVTRFLRLPSQVAALTGPVVDRLAPPPVTRPFRIVIVGCSSGAEPYTIASELFARRPDLDFSVEAYDIDPDLIAVARRGEYPRAEVTLNRAVGPEFLQRTFEAHGETLRVRPEVSSRVRFQTGDLLDPRFAASVAPADVVVAQNLLFHFEPRDSARAFGHLCLLLDRRGALLVDGMDVGARARLTRSHGLVPFDHTVREIHDEARVLRGSAWPWVYWGLEPYDAKRRNALRRYATIYFTPAAADAPSATPAGRRWRLIRDGGRLLVLSHLPAACIGGVDVSDLLAPLIL